VLPSQLNSFRNCSAKLLLGLATGSAIGSTLKGKYGEFGTGGEFRTPKLQRVE
jgi:hypothetical protein